MMSRAARGMSRNGGNGTLTNLPDPMTEAVEAARMIEEHRGAMQAWAQVRANAIRGALASGMSQSDVARTLGVSRQIVSRMLATYDGA